MIERKNIDKLYRETFKNAETPVPVDIWENISAQLPIKENRKRIIPIWYKIAGTAAVILLITSLYKISDTEYSKNNYTEVTNILDYEYLKLDPISVKFKEYMSNSNDTLQSIIRNTKYLVANQKKSVIGNSSFQNSGNLNGRSGRVISTNSNYLYYNTISESKEIFINDHSKSMLDEYSTYLAETSDHLNDSIQSLLSTSEDSINQLELIAEKQKGENKEDINEKSNKGRLSIALNTGAIHPSHFGREKALPAYLGDSDLNNDITSTYGLKVAYQLSDKIKVRSGVSNLNINRQINDVKYRSAINWINNSEENLISISSNDISNDLTNGNPRNTDYQFEDLNSERYTNSVMEQQSYSPASFDEIGILNQNLGFVEIPLEIEYSLIDKKLNLNLVGGLSTLILKESENIFEKSQSKKIAIQGSDNINKLSLTTNIGLGVNYEISPQLDFMLEPMFKYQLNTFKKSANYNPYFLGVYTGINYNF